LGGVAVLFKICVEPLVCKRPSTRAIKDLFKVWKNILMGLPKTPKMY
jgi:hypothetical protein